MWEQQQNEEAKFETERYGDVKISNIYDKMEWS